MSRFALTAILAVSSLLLASNALPLQAQTLPDHVQQAMLPDVKGVVSWSLLVKTTIRKTNGRLGPYFPDDVRALHGKIVKVQGFMLPLETGELHSRFLISAFSPSCPFCLTAGPETMIEVKLRSPVKYSLDPVLFEGKFETLDNDPGGVFYRLVDAAAVK
jgi:uncharacterized protein